MEYTSPLPDTYQPEIALLLARASLDAYLGPQHIDNLRRMYGANEARLIVASNIEALLLTFDTHAVLSFRGTEDWADAKVDLTALRSIWKGCSVHAGFLTAWQSIRPHIVAALQGNLLDGQPLLVTGHSLGGALATLCAADFAGGRYAGRTVVYTFGSPRVGDHRFATLFTERLGKWHWRIVHSNDGISRVPRLFRTRWLLPRWFPLLPTPRRFHTVGPLMFLTEDGHSLEKPSRQRLLAERILGFRFDIGRDHLMLNYLEAMV